MDNVSKAFRDHDKPNLRKDRDGISSRLLQQQFQGYKNEDPAEQQQKALPLSVVRRLFKIVSSKKEEAMAHMMIGAIYFAMRSCEYSEVSDAKNKKTKLLCIKNFRFFQKGKELPLDLPKLSEAECVAITFEQQKNNMKNETVTQERSGDTLLCPVRAWAITITRILSYPKTSVDTSINTFRVGKNLVKISSNETIKFLRKSVSSMDENSLGFKANEIGTHSLRSGGAMAMKLGGAEDSTIMLIGCWKSDSFLKYIRKQILQFSSNISCRMLENKHFTHIPNFQHDTSPSKNSMGSPPPKRFNSKKSPIGKQSKNGWSV